MHNFDVIAPTFADGEVLATKMRAADAAEVFASGGRSPQQAVRVSIENSIYCRALFIDGEIAAIWGVGPYPMDDVGAVWLLSTEQLEKFPLLVMRLARQEMRRMLSVRAVLVNAVDSRYKKALRFVERLGFRVSASHCFPETSQPIPFHTISIVKEDLNV